MLPSGFSSFPWAMFSISHNLQQPSVPVLSWVHILCHCVLIHNSLLGEKSKLSIFNCVFFSTWFPSFASKSSKNLGVIHGSSSSHPPAFTPLIFPSLQATNYNVGNNFKVNFFHTSCFIGCFCGDDQKQY